MMTKIGRALAAAATAFAGFVPTLFRDLTGLAGVGAIAYGAWLVFPPAGYIAGGVLLVIGAILAGRGAA